MTDIATTDNNQLQVADRAWELHKQIIGLRRDLEQTFLHLGQTLHMFESEKLFRVMGYKTFESYLADPEVNIGRRMAFMVKRVYQHWVLELESDAVALLDVGVSKLDLMTSVATPENRDELLAQGAALSRSDLRMEYTPSTTTFSDNHKSNSIEVTLTPDPWEKFEPAKWCDGCRETAEREFKYQMGWKRYAIRIEQELEQLRAQTAEQVVIDHDAPAPPINWQEEFAKI